MKLTKGYTKQNLAGDLTAGLLVGVMLVPQGMAYAMLAGLPPEMGLYSSVVPILAYSVLGSSRHLAVGPVAMVSLLTVTALSPIAAPGSSHYAALATGLSLMVGVLMLAMGFLRLGLIVNFMSHAVISGFTSAAAMIIVLSQLKHILGIAIPSSETAIELAAAASRQIRSCHSLTFALGGVSILAILLIRARWPRFPAPLLAVVLGTVCVKFLSLDQQAVAVVGVIPSGLPRFSSPMLSLADAKALIPAAVTITFVGYMEAIAIARTIASRERYRILPNKELVALGTANALGAFFGAYPATGSFSRTAVNYQAGAATRVASVIAAGVVILALAVLTPAFYYLPKAVLGAVVVTAVVKLVDVREAIRLFRLRSSDGWVLVTTFAATLALGAEKGILAGVALSLVAYVWRSAYPSIVELGYVDAQKGFRSIESFPNAQRLPETLILRIDRSVYFANVGFIEDRIREHVHNSQNLKWVVLDFSGVNVVDAVAAIDLLEMIRNYRQLGLRFLVAEVKAPVRDILARAAEKGEELPFEEGERLESALSRIGVMPGTMWRMDEPAEHSNL